MWKKDGFYSSSAKYTFSNGQNIGHYYRRMRHIHMYDMGHFNVNDFHIWCNLTSFIQPSVHDAVLDFHVPGEVPLQRELARTVEAFEGLAV